MVEIPAIPFLLNASAPRQIPVTSGADDGDLTVNSEIGRLRPEFISIRDWLGSTPKQSLLVGVAPGQSSAWMALSPATTVIKQPQVELNAAGSSLKIRGTQTVNNVESPAEANLPTATDKRVQYRGEVAGMRLYKVNLQEPSTFVAATSTAVASSAVDNPGNGEGEGEGEAMPALVLGDVLAEGESVAAASVTRADLFVPSASDVSTRTDAAVLPLANGDVWVGIESEQPKKLAGEAAAVDSAMQSVTDLSLDSKATDAIVGAVSLNQNVVDDVLRSALNES
jgi:hypothetical protein